MRDGTGAVLAEFLPPTTARRIRHAHCHCIANDMGSSLFRDRLGFELFLVRAPAGEAFISGDQPLDTARHQRR